MIDKISIEFKEYLKDKYNGYIEKCDNGELNIYIFDGCYHCKESYNAKKILQNYEYVVEMCNLYNEKILNTFIRNNIIWMTIVTIEGLQRDTSIRGYIQMLQSRIKFIDKVKNNGHELLTTYIDAKEKVLIDFKCGHEPNYLTPNSYLRGTMCPICSNKKIQPYVNDCYTLRPDLIDYFINPKDAIGVSVSDKKQRYFICPYCKTIKKDTIANISYFGFSCPSCSDGISYPNKFMYNLLSSLCVEFEREKHFDWCTYIDKNGDIRDGYYDFYIPSKRLFIEMDGALHYRDGFNNSHNDVQAIDEQKDFVAISNGYNIIRVNCNYRSGEDRFHHVKTNVLLQLGHIFDFSYIDWKTINNNASSSLKIEVINIWNENSEFTVTDIANKFKITYQSVIKYLKQGHLEGLCDYSESKRKERKTKKVHNKFNRYVKVVKDGIVVGVYYDYYVFAKNFNEYCKQELFTRKSYVDSVINGHRKTYKGFEFEEIDKLEYETLIKTGKCITDIFMEVA